MTVQKHSQRIPLQCTEYRTQMISAEFTSDKKSKILKTAS